MNKLSIVGIFYDGYEDLWIDFLYLFNRFWPDCPYPVYIVNNEKDINDGFGENIAVIHAGRDAEFSRKIQTALERIDSEYYLLLLEDFFVGKRINTITIENRISFIEKEKLKYYSMPLKEFQNIPNQKKYKEYGNLFRIMPDEEYTVSCQPAIWKKGFLQECIGTTNYNAWIFEGMYVRSEKVHTREFLDGCCTDNSNPLHLYHGALQGAIIPDTYQYFKKMGYCFYNQRRVLRRRQYAKHRLKMFVKRHVPLKAQKWIKKNMHVNSVIEKYEDEILQQIHSVIGE